jgi:hypothetical protein
VLKSKVIHEYLKSPKATADNVPRRHAGKSARNGASPALVVAALFPMLRGQPGRNLGDNDGTTRHLSGLGFRVLAFGLARLPLASRMTTRENPAGKAIPALFCLPKRKMLTLCILGVRFPL